MRLHISHGSHVCVLISASSTSGCDVTCCVIFIMSFTCYCTISRAKVPMKLNAPDDLLSKGQNIFDIVLIMD